MLGFKLNCVSKRSPRGRQRHLNLMLLLLYKSMWVLSYYDYYADAVPAIHNGGWSEETLTPPAWIDHELIDGWIFSQADVRASCTPSSSKAKLTNLLVFMVDGHHSMKCHQSSTCVLSTSHEVCAKQSVTDIFYWHLWLGESCELNYPIFWERADVRSVCAVYVQCFAIMKIFKYPCNCLEDITTWRAPWMAWQ